MKKVVFAILPIITVLYIVFVCMLICDQKTPDNCVSLETGTRQQVTASPSSSITPEGKININIATTDELIYLSGIGEVLAQRIVEYRETNGPYTQVTDLLNIKGIGEVKLNNIINYIAVE